MTRPPDKIEFCTPECRDNGGWKLDPATLLPAERRECRYDTTISPTAAKAEGQAAAVEANPAALDAAMRIIDDTRQRMQFFSANDCRHEMTIAQIPGPVIAAAFGKAVKSGWIRRDGYVPSTDPGTHGHEVKRWQSLHRKWRAAS